TSVHISGLRRCKRWEQARSPCYVKDPTRRRRIKFITDFPNVFVRRQNPIFRMVEELRKRESGHPSSDDHVVFLHLRLQEPSHFREWPSCLVEKLRMNARRPTRNDQRCEAPRCNCSPSCPDVSRDPVNSLGYNDQKQRQREDEITREPARIDSNSLQGHENRA